MEGGPGGRFSAARIFSRKASAKRSGNAFASQWPAEMQTGAALDPRSASESFGRKITSRNTSSTDSRAPFAAPTTSPPIRSMNDSFDARILPSMNEPTRTKSSQTARKTAAYPTTLEYWKERFSQETAAS
jgi:hypothetical protein